MLTAARAWPTMARIPTTALAFSSHRVGWTLLARNGRTTMPLRLLLIRERAARIDARVAEERAANLRALEEGTTLLDDVSATAFQPATLA